MFCVNYCVLCFNDGGVFFFFDVFMMVCCVFMIMCFVWIMVCWCVFSYHFQCAFNTDPSPVIFYCLLIVLQTYFNLNVLRVTTVLLCTTLLFVTLQTYFNPNALTLIRSLITGGATQELEQVRLFLTMNTIENYQHN